MMVYGDDTTAGSALDKAVSDFPLKYHLHRSSHRPQIVMIWAERMKITKAEIFGKC